MPSKNCVTNAISHIKNRYVLCLDIENFFESIKVDNLLKYVPEEILNIVLVNKVVVQGFPTSPILSNIGMIDVDFELIMALRKIKSEITYSRYADDLTISFNDLTFLPEIKDCISSILNSHSLNLNLAKTSLQDKDKGRAIITGIGVSYSGIHPSRKTLKKIRAAKHQKNLRSYIGLNEWSKCKKPRDYNG